MTLPAMTSLHAYALVFLGAGLGGAMRHGVNLAALHWLGAGFPYGIFAINVTGSLAMGLVAGWLSLHAGSDWAAWTRLFLATGVLGGYTTFSAFSLDAMALIERGAFGLAALYAIGSVVASVAACGLGLIAGRGFA
jgi:CrcB protein